MKSNLLAGLLTAMIFVAQLHPQQKVVRGRYDRTEAERAGNGLLQGVPRRYYFLYEPGGIRHEERVLRGLPFEHIQLERSACLGRCPVYKITLSKDGTATYRGDQHVERLGKYTGHVDTHSFARLCWAIERLRLPDEKCKPNWRYTCGSQAFIRLKSNDGQKTEITDSAMPAVIEFELVASYIDKISRNIKWQPKSSD